MYKLTISRYLVRGCWRRRYVM